MLSIYRLPNKLPDEKVVKVLHRDYFILFKKVLFFILLAILPFIFFRIMTLSFPALLNSLLSYTAVLLAASAYYLFIWLFFFFSFIDFYLDVWLVTNKRIINVEQEGFFSRTISEQKLCRIQDITSEVKGALPTIFKYGNVHIQTAGEEKRFVFEEVPNPDEVRNLLIKLTNMDKAEHEAGNMKQET
jgi:membrane protein YdbS with pleckstrin-like domain